ncbi:MAG: hypothetical protein ACREE7_13970 [Dongiaceae bacterium]
MSDLPATRRLFVWLNRQLLPIIQASRWRRVSAMLAAYALERNGKPMQLPDDAARTMQALIAEATLACERGEIELAWRCYHAARRLELVGLSDDARLAAASIMRKEAAKLGAWRKEAIQNVLGPEDAPNATVERLYQAAEARDEHYDNEAYKDRLRRGAAIRLAVVLVILLPIILWAFHGGYIDVAACPGGTIECPDLAQALIGVALFGLLGATVSAILAKPSATDSPRIPEMASTVRVTILRLLMGPASAILVYLAVRSELYEKIFAFGRPDPIGMLVIAFVAGFSERLVLSVVEAIAGKPAG